MRAALIAVALALAAPSTALAHGNSGRGYISKVTEIVGAPGLDATASGDGHFIVTPPPHGTVIVDGYDGEPYIKFARGKVWENDNSPTRYLNINAEPPASAHAGAEPDWVLQVGGPQWTWYDRRIGWNAPTRPPVVQSNPQARHHILDWRVPGTIDGRPFTIYGSLDWGVKHSRPRWEWLSYVAIAGFVAYLVLGRLQRR